MIFSQKPKLLAFLAIAGIGLAALAPSAIAADPGRGSTWETGPKFSGKKKIRKSISGAACVPVELPNCIVALDEGKHTQFFTIKDKTLVPGAVMRVLPEKNAGQVFKEIDAEGAAYADGYFYLVGSHGLSRKKAKYNPANFFVFRFPVDITTGKPVFAFSADKAAPEIARTDALRQVLKRAPGAIGEYTEKPLGKKAGGVNFEGVAVIGNRMFLGLRGPSKRKQAYVMSVDLSGLFGKVELTPEYSKVELGKKTGIRDLAAVPGGLLILSGPVGGKGSYAIHHWNLEDKKPEKLLELIMPEKGAKAETLLLLGHEDGNYQVLVLYDGIADGGPREYVLRR